MILDSNTLLVSQALIEILMSVLMGLLWRNVRPDARGVGLWALSFALALTGHFLIALRGHIPYALTMVPANTLMVAGILALPYGAAAFLGIKIPKRYAVTTLILFALSFIVFGHIIPALRVRSVILYSVFLLVSLSCATILYRHAEKEIRWNAHAVIVTMVAFAVLSALRIYVACALPINLSLRFATPLESVIMMAMAIDQIAMAFTLIELVDARLRAQVAKSAEEKTLLVREMHHRTKNDFAIVESLISLETSELPECGTSEALNRVKDRIHSFALLHDRLYHGKATGTVDAGEYLSLIASGLVGSGSKDRRIELRTNVEEVVTSAGSAVSLGLIVNELITNALKHAFPGGRSGTISLSLSVQGTTARLEVADDGIGLAKPALVIPQEGLGMTLVSSLVAQINGALDRTSSQGEGVRTTLTFSLPQAARAEGHV